MRLDRNKRPKKRPTPQETGIKSPNAHEALKDATVQEIQLELIRRTEFNGFRGERIVHSLQAHRNLWESALLDRIGVSNPGKPPHMGLIKLRDMRFNLWNADTLYVLCQTVKDARTPHRFAKKEDWGGEQWVFENADDLDTALGGPAEGKAVLCVWWD